jgi:hypothetical protein
MPLPRFTASWEVIMLAEKIGNIVDMVSANTKTRASVRRQPNAQTENMQSDIVSIGNSVGAGDIGKIHWAPLFPIGDAQCIFKVEK